MKSLQEFGNNFMDNNLHDLTVSELSTLLEKKEISSDPKCLLVIKKNEKISRNEKCLATGKKYKHCCGAL